MHEKVREETCQDVNLTFSADQWFVTRAVHCRSAGHILKRLTVQYRPVAERARKTRVLKITTSM